MPAINKATYTFRIHASVEGWFDRIIQRKRAAMLALLDDAIAAKDTGVQTAIDIGSSSDTTQPSSNYLARAVGGRCALTLFSDQVIGSSADLGFPVVKTIVGDATRIGENLGTFDLVMSNATIEHVGSTANQAGFLAECLRLSTRYVFITTPNRWHPLEFHTRLPFLHWLPKRWHRGILRRLGLEFFSIEGNLNLLDRRSLEALIATSPEHGRIVDWRVAHVRFLGFVSNLVLIIRTQPKPGGPGMPQA